MPLELGGAFRSRPVPVVAEPAPPSLEDLRSERLLLALSNLQDALNSMPAPVVHVAEPDLSAIVQAVTQLNGPVSAQDIARAVREEIAPAPSPTIEPVLGQLTEALERLDFRMKGITSGGSGGASNITSDPLRVLGKVDDDESQALLTTIRDEQMRRTDPLASGSNVIGAVSPSLSVFSAVGQVWAVGGMVALSTTAPSGSVHLSNPSTSTKTVTIVQWSVFAQTGNARVRYFHEATSTGTVTAPFQTSHGGAAPLTEVRIGTGALTGGSEVPAGHIVASAAPLEKQVPIIVPPGHSFAIQVVGYGLSATAVDFGLNVAFREA